MFNIFYLIEGKWYADENNPHRGPRTMLAKALRSKDSKRLWKIRKI